MQSYLWLVAIIPRVSIVKLTIDPGPPTTLATCRHSRAIRSRSGCTSLAMQCVDHVLYGGATSITLDRLAVYESSASRLFGLFGVYSGI